MGTYIKYPRVYNNIPIFIIARDLSGLAFLENGTTILKIYRVIREGVHNPTSPPVLLECKTNLIIFLIYKSYGK